MWTVQSKSRLNFKLTSIGLPKRNFLRRKIGLTQGLLLGQFIDFQKLESDLSFM